MKKVVVIGGGISGIGAAFTLQEKVNEGAKIDYVLLEQDNRLGGKIITEDIKGFVIEGGPDSFLSEKPFIPKITEKLGFEDRFMGSNDSSKGTFVYSKGKLKALPDGMMLMMPTKILPFAFSSLISWPGKFRMALDLILPTKKEDQDESLGSFVKRRLGDEALDKIAEPLIAGIHAGDPETMSLKANFPRFLHMEKSYGSLIKAMLTARKMGEKAAKASPRAPGKYEKTYFMSYKKGMRELSEQLIARIPKEKIKLGIKVTEIIERKPEAGQSRYLVKLAGQEALEADAVIVATQGFVAAELMKGVDQELSAKLDKIPHITSATISLGYKKKDVKANLEAFGFVIPHAEKRRIKAATYSSSKWKLRTPDDEHVLIRTFMGSAKNQEIVNLSDEEVLEISKKEIKEILGITGEPVVEKVYRWVKGMPQYVMGHLELMDEIEAKVAKHDGLYLVGGSYRGVGLGDCMNAGFVAATKAVELLDR